MINHSYTYGLNAAGVWVPDTSDGSGAKRVSLFGKNAVAGDTALSVPSPATAVDQSGGLGVVMTAIDGTTQNRFRQIESMPASADGRSTAYQALFSIARNELFNGTSWDRQRSNEDRTLLASATRTATTNSADQINYNARGIMVHLNVTAASGTGGLFVQIQTKDPVSGSYGYIAGNPPSITTTGYFTYVWYPGASVAAANSLKYVGSTIVPRIFRIQVAHGDASNYDYSVGASLIV